MSFDEVEQESSPSVARYETGQRVLARAANRKDWEPAVIVAPPRNHADVFAQYWVQFDDYVHPAPRSDKEIKSAE